jgi:hypothetical protein
MLYFYDKLRHSVTGRNPYELSFDDALRPRLSRVGLANTGWGLSALCLRGLSLVVCRWFQ